MRQNNLQTKQIVVTHILNLEGSTKEGQKAFELAQKLRPLYELLNAVSQCEKNLAVTK